MSKTIVDPRAEAMKYLENHRLLILFDILGAKLAKEKPESPNDFILDELNRIAQMKASEQPVTLFSREDVETLFSTFDITGKGFVSQLQYRKGLAAVGIDSAAVSVPDMERIDQETFVESLYNEILKRAY
mmetsp:Transcript_27129/g.20298  ORF Transcript_27129/g.20298 Transcript_27129/m.20298 type:complete len:130 (+) Transcript_27129:121-510(+)